MRVKIYVEGGGDSKEQHVRCREGFRKLLEKAGFKEHMPAIVAGGGRNATFDQFRTAFLKTSNRDETILLLVDSETPLSKPAWTHLKDQDGWECPNGAGEDHVQFMVTCMETWILADHQALRTFFGQSLNENALPTLNRLEARTRQEVQNALEAATRSCERDRRYRKGNRSFKILAALNPDILKENLPHFQRLIDTLDHILKEG